MPTIKDFALRLLGNSPSLANNPNAQHLIQVIKEGNSSEGEQIAQNICDSYGVTKEQAIQDAKRFFGLP